MVGDGTWSPAARRTDAYPDSADASETKLTFACSFLDGASLVVKNLGRGFRPDLHAAPIGPGRNNLQANSSAQRLHHGYSAYPVTYSCSASRHDWAEQSLRWSSWVSRSVVSGGRGRFGWSGLKRLWSW